MSKMNFEYMPQRQPAQAAVRLPLLTLGYLVLAVSLAWMAAPLLIQ
jgi:hypothetical protein